MRKIAMLFVLLFGLSSFVACGGATSQRPNSSVPTIAGEYQIVFTSNVYPSIAANVLEVDIQQATDRTDFYSSSGHYGPEAYNGVGLVFDTCATGCTSRNIDVANSGNFSVPVQLETFGGTVDAAGAVQFTTNNEGGQPVQATGTYTTSNFSGTYTVGAGSNDSGTWVAIKSNPLPATATFTATGGTQWTMSVTGATVTLDIPSLGTGNQLQCQSTFVGDVLFCEITAQQYEYYIIIPDGSVPSGFDLARYSDTVGFVELLTDQN